MTELTDSLLAKFNNSPAVVKHRATLCTLEDEFMVRVKRVPAFKNENHNMVVANELYEALRDILAGRDPNFNSQVLCPGCQRFVRCYRCLPRRLYAHNCSGFDLASYELSEQNPREQAIPISDSVKEADKEFVKIQAYAKQREAMVKQRILNRYIDQRVEGAVGLPE